MRKKEKGVERRNKGKRKNKELKNYNPHPKNQKLPIRSLNMCDPVGMSHPCRLLGGPTRRKRCKVMVIGRNLRLRRDLDRKISAVITGLTR